jgi:hypothetical protein
VIWPLRRREVLAHDLAPHHLVTRVRRRYRPPASPRVVIAEPAPEPGTTYVVVFFQRDLDQPKLIKLRVRASVRSARAGGTADVAGAARRSASPAERPAGTSVEESFTGVRLGPARRQAD